jgi:hypothetical protein
MEDIMSVPKQDPQATFFDATFLAQDLFDSEDRHEIFRREVYPALQAMRQELCQLYCPDNGRPGIEPVIMAGVTLLQFMENVPDRKAVELIRLHLGWKHALNLTINYPGFHPTCLVSFRERLMTHKEGRLIFDGILRPLHDKRLVKRGGKQRLDSTHVLGAVARIGRLELVRETIRLFLEAAGVPRARGNEDGLLLGEEEHAVVAVQAGVAVLEMRRHVARHHELRPVRREVERDAAGARNAIAARSKRHLRLIEQDEVIFLAPTFSHEGTTLSLIWPVSAWAPARGARSVPASRWAVRGCGEWGVAARPST